MTLRERIYEDIGNSPNGTTSRLLALHFRVPVAVIRSHLAALDRWLTDWRDEAGEWHYKRNGKQWKPE